MYFSVGIKCEEFRESHAIVTVRSIEKAIWGPEKANLTCSPLEVPSRGPHRQETTQGTVVQILALLFLMETRPAVRRVRCEFQRLCGQLSRVSSHYASPSTRTVSILSGVMFSCSFSCAEPQSRCFEPVCVHGFGTEVAICSRE